MPLTGTGKEAASGGASSDGQALYEIERPLSNFDSTKNTYKKVHKFMTFGLATAILQPAATSGRSYLTTYLAEIPWHIPALYLNSSEYALLPTGTYVTGVEIEIYYRGSTIQFETASTSTGLATLNQINDIAVAHALNKTGQGSNVSFTSFNSTQPMIPTGIAKPKYAPIASNYRGMVRDFYGSDNSDANFRGDIPKHQIGRQTFLYNYWGMSATGLATPVTPAQTQSGGWPMLADKINQVDGKTVVNKCVLKSSYKPKQGQIKAPLRTIGHGVPMAIGAGNVVVPINGNLASMRTNAIAQVPSTINADGYQLTATETNVTPGNNTIPNFTIYTPIEKSQFTRSGFWGEADAHIQPSLHVGVQPVPALTTSSLLAEDNQFNQWTDTRAYWEVIAIMHTSSRGPTAYPYATAANVPLGENVIFSSVLPAVNLDARNDGATVAGLYSTAEPGLPV
nr:MAG: capsid protein [Emberiza rustica ambidensovirus]